jgi:Asp-tRNA(Asn)/Glu-tRNA(Gln) amidotransferase A subunit family amidase
MRPSPGRLSTGGIVHALGTCVGDLALLDSVLSKTALVKKTDLAGRKFIVPKDWIAARAEGGLSATVQESLDFTKAALEAVGAEVVEMDGFLSVVETDKEQWVMPTVPFVFDNSHEDLTKYLGSLGDARPAATVEDIIAKVQNAGVVRKFTKPQAEDEELEKKTKARDEARTGFEAAYRAFFKDNGVSAVVLPCFPKEITKIDIENESLSEFMNEYVFTMHMNEIPVPSMVQPVRSIKHPESQVPCSMLVFGTEDRELLQLALGIEDAIAVKEGASIKHAT